MSKEKKEKKAHGAFAVEPITKQLKEANLLEEPLHIINEIIANTNSFVQANQPELKAMLYLGSAQRYAIRFINEPGILDPMQGTFAGIPVIWVEAPYHVNLVARRDDPEQG